MTSAAHVPPGSNRRDELLRIAATLFAERGFRNTTVRDIADAAGILSGSLYHHFDSKEAMVDELLDTFQQELFETFEAIVASDRSPRTKLEAVVRVSFEAIDQHHSEVAIFQNDAAFLAGFERFAYLSERNHRFERLWRGLLQEGVDAGELRPDLDVDLVYRFLRDTVWVAVTWYRPGGALSADQVADQYLTILLEGISERNEEVEEVAERSSRDPASRQGVRHA
jgi:AcrR family transcriptional regulator